MSLLKPSQISTGVQRAAKAAKEAIGLADTISGIDLVSKKAGLSPNFLKSVREEVGLFRSELRRGNVSPVLKDSRLRFLAANEDYHEDLGIGRRARAFRANKPLNDSEEGTIFRSPLRDAPLSIEEFSRDPGILKKRAQHGLGLRGGDVGPGENPIRRVQVGDFPYGKVNQPGNGPGLVGLNQPSPLGGLFNDVGAQRAARLEANSGSLGFLGDINKNLTSTGSYDYGSSSYGNIMGGQNQRLGPAPRKIVDLDPRNYSGANASVLPPRGVDQNISDLLPTQTPGLFGSDSGRISMPVRRSLQPTKQLNSNAGRRDITGAPNLSGKIQKRGLPQRKPSQAEIWQSRAKMGLGIAGAGLGAVGAMNAFGSMTSSAPAQLKVSGPSEGFGEEDNMSNAGYSSSQTYLDPRSFRTIGPMSPNRMGASGQLPLALHNLRRG